MPHRVPGVVVVVVVVVWVPVWDVCVVRWVCVVWWVVMWVVVWVVVWVMVFISVVVIILSSPFLFRVVVCVVDRCHVHFDILSWVHVRRRAGVVCSFGHVAVDDDVWYPVPVPGAAIRTPLRPGGCS